MALHRDIYWVGKQWTVTGYGIQACDQKQKSKFDIEAARLWEDGVLESVRALKWLNSEDFDRAVDVARKHFPEPPRKAVPPPEPVLVVEAAAPEPAVLAQIAPVLNETGPMAMTAAPPKPVLQKFAMRIESWPAKFVPQWRVRMRR